MNSRRVRAALTLASVVLSVAPAHALQARPAPAQRTVDAPYLTPVLGASVHVEGETTVYYYDCLGQIGCAIIPVKKGDRSAVLEVVDAAGQPVLGSIFLVPGFGHYDYFCGQLDEPIDVRGTTEILVHVISGVCPDGTPSLATHGVVRATFSGRR
ncbi:MAG: hypothetical protein ACRDKT_00285 [Actinomycetota bacterium]